MNLLSLPVMYYPFSTQEVYPYLSLSKKHGLFTADIQGKGKRIIFFGPGEKKREAGKKYQVLSIWSSDDGELDKGKYDKSILVQLLYRAEWNYGIVGLSI